MDELGKQLQNNNEKLLLHAIEIEQIVLGELLFAPHLYDEITFLRGKHFSSETLGKIYEIMVRLAKEDNLDFATLKINIVKSDLPVNEKEIKGWVNLSTTVTKIISHAQEIIDCFQRRQIAGVCERALEDVYFQDIVKVKNDIINVVEGTQTNKLIALTPKEIIAVNRREDGMMPIKTNYTKLDNFLGGGLSRQSMVTVAASTSIGKSQFSLNLLLQSTIDGKRVRPLYISQEMGEQEIEDRCVAILSGVKIGACRALRTGQAFETTIKKYSKDYLRGLERFNNIQMRVYAKGSITSVDFKELVAKYHKEVDLICLDYLQQVAPANYNQTVRSKVDEISRICKQTATHYNIPVIAVAQLSREANREDRPQLHHLKESSGIEQDSDYVFLLYREKINDANSEPLEVNLAKNRHGMLGVVDLNYILDQGVILEL